jgi:hypothetical protein
MLPPKIVRWLALFDQLTIVYRARDHPAFDATFLALSTYDHDLTAGERMTARLARWRRDTPFEPLPKEKERAWWGRCLCRTCAVARTLEQHTTTHGKREQR